jgi:hypothetical protein
MASPENKWGQRAVAGAEFVGAGASFIAMVTTVVETGISPIVAIWGVLGLALGIDAKNRWAKTNKSETNS